MTKAQLEARVKELEVQLDDVLGLKMKSLHIEGGQMEMTLEVAEFIRNRMGVALIQTLDAVGAKNYTQTEVTYEGREYLMTVCRRVGKTPHQLRVEAEAERDQLRARVAGLEAR